MSDAESRTEPFRDRLVRWKAPETAWARPMRTTLRTLHLLGMAAFFGAAAYGLEGSQLKASMHAAVTTGVIFAPFEIWRAPVWLVQVRGVATLLWPPGRLALAVVLVAIGSVISHAPAKCRYYSFLHARAIESGGRG